MSNFFLHFANHAKAAMFTIFLIQTKTPRGKLGIVVQTGEARETHHFALLLGYGACAVYPYLAYQTIEDMVKLTK